MYAAGLPVLAETDAVGPFAPNSTLQFGDMLHRELQYLVEDVGMSVAETIHAATRVSAKDHRLNDRSVIGVGMRADLVLLGSNPLTSIKSTRDIVDVWVDGRRFAGPLGGKAR
jgi:imidazolonepropionase-like amidohydrolase